MAATTASWATVADAGAESHEHVPELADRRIGQDPFQVGLSHGDRGRQDRPWHIR